MKLYKLLLPLLLLNPAIASAQPFSAQIVRALNQFHLKAAADPYTCNAVQEYKGYYNTATHKYMYCNGTAWTPWSSSGTVTGTGTANNVSKWTSATAQGNSSITDDGTTVTTGETVLLNGAGLTHITSTQGTTPASAPFITHTATWSTTATYTNFFSNITDSGPSNANSLLMDLQVGGASKFSIVKSGATTVGSLINGSTTNIRWASRTAMFSPANGQWQIQNNGASANLYLQIGTSATRPSVASGFGTSPVINTNASDTAGSINIGTGGVASTGTINFTQTWPVAPFCLAEDSSGFVATHATASTTVLTLTSTAVWGASAVVVWHCIAAN